jgi:hypothetical protein
VKDPCETCAFKPGSVTHDAEPQNHLRGELCAQGGIPFYCHHDRAGEVQDLRELKMSTREAVQAGKVVICQGWRRAVRELAAAGYFKDSPKLKRTYAQVGLGALLIFIDEEEGPKKCWAAKTLKDVILALNGARGYTEVVEDASGREEVS